MRNKCLVITAFLLATWGISTTLRGSEVQGYKGAAFPYFWWIKRFDQNPDAQAAVFIAPYKHKVDSIMSPVVGETAHYMAAGRPESELSNLLCDILVWAGKDFEEKPVFSVYNMGGIRAALAKGKQTVGDVNDMAPFENKICFLTLTGKDVLELFSQIAMRGGEGVSHAVKMDISKDGSFWMLHSTDNL